MPSVLLAHFEDVLVDVPFHLIVFHFHASCARSLVDSIALRSMIAGTGVGDLVPCDHEVACQRLNIEAVSFFRAAVVQNLVTSEAVAMPAVLKSLFPEVDACKAIAGNCVVNEDIVCVFVADGNTVLAVVLDPIVFEAAITHPPTQKKAYLAVVVNAATPHRGMRTTGTWMNSVTRVAMGFAVEHLNVIRDLKRNAIAVVVSSHTIANDGVLRSIEINGSAAAAVNIGVLCLVSVHNEILKDDAVSLNRAEDWKAVSNRSLLFLGVVISQRHRIDMQQITFNRLDRGHGDIPATIEQLVGDADSHSRAKLLWVRHSELTFSIVTILS